MSPSAEGLLLVLHALRVKGSADAGLVGSATGLALDDVDRRLEALSTGGVVVHREGPLGGWALTTRGRREHGALVAKELEACGCRAAVEDAYRRFLGLNPELLAACTAWQLRDLDGRRVANDHADAAYDRATVERLVEVHTGVAPVLADLRAALARFARYGPRLAAAVDNVVAGKGEWFTRPLVDSYHTVWFELHEDLLATLGRERAAEGSLGAA